MASGENFVATVEEGLETMIASARAEGEFPADVMLKACDRERLSENSGTAWREFLAAKLTAQNYSETQDIENSQELDGSILSATPQLAGILVFIGDRVPMRLSRKAFDTFGGLSQAAMHRKMDTDGLAMAATATTTLAGSGTTLTSGHVRAGVRRITSDATEPGLPPINLVLHGYGLHDIESQVLSGVGTYPIPEGYTAQVYMQGYRGMLATANVYEDGLISIDSTPDARGMVFAKRALICVQGKSPWVAKERVEKKGYGGWNVYHRDEYIWAERSPGNWLFGILHDATAPTS